jgi:predicted AlkP superfamily pyrophosphatase or phosphodiesterase
MINDHTLERFLPLGDRLLRPIYGDYSFGNIPATLHYLLTGETTGSLLPADCFGGSYPTPQKIVLILVDSFGWQFWQRHGQRSRIMRRVIDRGVLTPISALFPSTTAASISTLNLGCLPGRHAVYEWNLYVPEFGETIQSLAFATLGRHAVSCTSKGYDARDMVIEHETVHQRLARRGARSIQLSHRSYARSPYNKIISAGAEVIAHGTFPEALVDLKRVLATTKDKALISLYWAGLDTSAHQFGPGSPEHEAEVWSFWLTMDAILADVVSPDTLFVFTADHGHVGGRAGDTIYVNERWPEINGWLTTSPTGETIWPNGSPRDMFLHVQPERRAEMLAVLAKGLAGIADVMTVDDGLAAGLFGPEPVGQELRRRLGDVLILPYLGHFVWWRESGIIENPFHGHHGGLSAEELVTVLGVVDSVGEGA